MAWLLVHGGKKQNKTNDSFFLARIWSMDSRKTEKEHIHQQKKLMEMMLKL